ncbi:MAG: hypothetical protein CMH54_03875 [Myxococcales bacterium]|nr:hypothetical protein [Myxococcales bacterium]
MPDEPRTEELPAVSTSSNRFDNSFLSPMESTSVLTTQEWGQLEDLRDRVQNKPYHVALGLESDVSPSDAKHRIAVQLAWLEELSGRSGLTAEERNAIQTCREHLPLARWVLTDTTLGPAYLSAIRARTEGAGQKPGQDS